MLVQPAGYVHSLALLEVGELLAGSIASLGLPCRLQTNRLATDAVNIVLGYQLLQPREAGELTGRNVIFYQLEQLSTEEGWFLCNRRAVRIQAVRSQDEGRPP